MQIRVYFCCKAALQRKYSHCSAEVSSVLNKGLIFYGLIIIFTDYMVLEGAAA